MHDRVSDEALKRFAIIPETAGLSSVRAMAAELQSYRQAARAVSDPDEESACPLMFEGESLENYIARIGPPGPFKPLPYFCEGDAIVWYWDASEHEYSMPVMHGGQWIGSLYVAMDTKKIIGMRIHIRDELRERVQRHYSREAVAVHRVALAECRKEAAYIVDSLGETPVKYRAAAQRCITRIDDLLGKEASDAHR